LQAGDRHLQIFLYQGAGRPGGEQRMMRKEIPVVLCPFKKVFLLVVVRNKGDLLLSSHGDNLMAHETALRMMVFSCLE
jgi:hypothetical protein